MHGPLKPFIDKSWREIEIEEVKLHQADIGDMSGLQEWNEKDALYLPGQVTKNDGKTAYTITVPKDVSVGGSWSVTVYNTDRYMVKNKYNAYSFFLRLG